MSDNKSDNATQIPGLTIEFPGLETALKSFSASLTDDDWRSIMIVWGANVITGQVKNVAIPEYDSVVVSMENIEMSFVDSFAKRVEEEARIRARAIQRARADLLGEVPTKGDST